MREPSPKVKRCLYVASGAVVRGCENSIERIACLRIAEGWTLRAYKIDRAEHDRDAAELDACVVAQEDEGPDFFLSLSR